MLLQFINAHQCDISFTALNPLISRFYNFILRRMRIARRLLRQPGAHLTRESYLAVQQRHAPLLPSKCIARLTQELWRVPGGIEAN
jgi:hypothetical protein